MTSCISNQVTSTVKTSECLTLKEGSQIPGYRGHCPILRYDFGKTYGQGSHDAYLTRKGTEEIGTSDYRDDQVELLAEWNRRGRNETIQEEPVARTTNTGLTLSGGVTKYTEEMVPGYTGYIPRYPFKFGKRYKEECHDCLTEHFSMMQRHSLSASRSIGDRAKRYSIMESKKENPAVKEQLNNFSLALAARSSPPRKGVYSPAVLDMENELPVSGYVGFVPRVHVTEIGLGSSFKEQTKNGLDLFYSEKARRAAMLRFSRETHLENQLPSSCENKEPTARIQVQNSTLSGKHRPLSEGKEVSGYNCKKESHSFESHPTKTQKKAVAFVV